MTPAGSASDSPDPTEEGSRRGCNEADYLSVKRNLILAADSVVATPDFGCVVGQLGRACPGLALEPW
jgi:hypothetical protein